MPRTTTLKAKYQIRSFRWHVQIRKAQFCIVFIQIFYHNKGKYAYRFALNIFQEIYLIGTRTYTFTEDNLAQILHWRIVFITNTEIEMMILVGNNGLFGVQTVYIESDIGLKIRKSFFFFVLQKDIFKLSTHFIPMPI